MKKTSDLERTRNALAGCRSRIEQLEKKMTEFEFDRAMNLTRLKDSEEIRTSLSRALGDMRSDLRDIVRLFGLNLGEGVVWDTASEAQVMQAITEALVATQEMVTRAQQQAVAHMGRSKDTDMYVFQRLRYIITGK